jgi:hypothetical protein
LVLLTLGEDASGAEDCQQTRSGKEITTIWHAPPVDAALLSLEFSEL